MEKGKVIVGLSGGVDSTVAGYLLKKEGYEVIGVTLDLYGSSNQDKALTDGKRVADALGIEHIVVSLKEEFKKLVVDNFMDSYLDGLTPNPCVVCNPNIKFHALLGKAEELGADFIATGHYAKIDIYEKTNRYAITNSATAKKDQTYALYGLKQNQLKSMILPIGEYEKDQIREIAKNIDGYIAEKKDSQDICFIPDGEYVNFIQSNRSVSGVEGNFVNEQGEVLGKHRGILHYTVGQRKGLGIAFGSPMYVKDILPERNEVVLCENDNLFSNELTIKDISYMAVDKFENNARVLAKIRYSHKKAWCRLEVINDNLVKCIFDEPQRAITPGQSVVLYDEEFILGGGIICK